MQDGRSRTRTALAEEELARARVGGAAIDDGWIAGVIMVGAVVVAVAESLKEVVGRSTPDLQQPSQPLQRQRQGSHSCCSSISPTTAATTTVATAAATAGSA